MIHARGESFDVRDGAAAIAVEPGSAVVTIPDAHFLFTADFKRKGPDLVLTGEDGLQALLAAAQDDGSGNSVITADPHDTITIKNVTVAQLVQHQGDFHFT